MVLVTPITYLLRSVSSLDLPLTIPFQSIDLSLYFGAGEVSQKVKSVAAAPPQFARSLAEIAVEVGRDRMWR
jgi:hypothetical protein